MHKYWLSLISLLLIAIGLSCSSTGNQLKYSDDYYSEVPMPEQALAMDYPEPDVWAKYPGGHSALQSHIMMNTVIPEPARRGGYGGRLLLTYVVDREGKAGQVEIVMSPHDSISEMYEKIVGNMERWKPAILNGEPVEQLYIISTLFNDTSSE
ncbi:MAG: energy transducer TonB [Balneolaceae bacterium]